MPKIVDPAYIRKSESHKSILISVPKDLLHILETIIPNYKRSYLIVSLLREFVSKHGQDPINTKTRPSKVKSKKKSKYAKRSK